ncbi:SCND3 protein, partial [Polyodon spathula]|nr:SCND3 protein [Polyodon spathula]
MSRFYAIQLDETTYIAGAAQLLVYIRFGYEESLMEEFLFCRPLLNRTTGKQIFAMLDNFIREGMRWDQCIGICSDGARSMTGKQSCLVTREVKTLLIDAQSDLVNHLHDCSCLLYYIFDRLNSLNASMQHKDPNILLLTDKLIAFVLTHFWLSVAQEFHQLFTAAVNVLLPFASSYLYEGKKMVMLGCELKVENTCSIQIFF